jgi:hypothetical protein
MPIFRRRKKAPDPELSGLSASDAELAIYKMAGIGYFSEVGDKKAAEIEKRLKEEFYGGSGSKEKHG